MRLFSMVVVLAAGAGNLACVSAATYERDLAAARSEERATQRSAALQVEALRTALEAMQRSLAAEAELRVASLRGVEEKLRRLEQQAAAPPVPAAVAPVAAPVVSGDNPESLRAELKKIQEQERESSARMRRIEEALQRLSTGSKVISVGEGDVKNPWGKLHAYPH
jgi:DNA repair exonuclease SbcCD ATPase subunit